MNPLLPIVLEWVRTNGDSAGFNDRVLASKDLWSKVGPEGMTVYRGQGHTKPGIDIVGDPATLVAGVRPVLATSKTLASVLEYAGADCCIFEIHLAPGTPYIDVNETIGLVAPPPDETTLAVLKEVSATIADKVPQQSRNALWKTVKSRSKENEIMVYGIGGTFGPLADAGMGGGKKKYTTTYSIAVSGRGRTFRRKPKRRNKNGRRSARQSLRRRNRDA